MTLTPVSLVVHALRDNAVSIVTGDLEAVARAVLIALNRYPDPAPIGHGAEHRAVVRQLEAVDDILARIPSLGDSEGRLSKLLKCVERAADADRIESRWKIVLEAQDALGRSYARIRETLRAADVPNWWVERNAAEVGIPVEQVDGEPQTHWAWTEYQALQLRRQRDAFLKTIDLIRETVDDSVLRG